MRRVRPTDPQEEELSDAHLRLSRTLTEHLFWQKCIKKYDRENTLFYFDPPYWQTEGYGVDFGLEQYQEMAKLMRGIKGRAILSINDHPEIREVFAGFTTKEVPITYTVGGAGRSVKRQELIILSW